MKDGDLIVKMEDAPTYFDISAELAKRGKRGDF